MLLTVLTTGLFAGYFLAFLTGVMPGLRRLPDAEFAMAMRRVNETVPRPVFLALFAAVVVLPLGAWLFPVDGRSATATGLLLAGLGCVVANHLVTVVGNVPLNNALAASEGAGRDGEARAAFEKRWNTLHLVRTLLSVAGFALVTAAAM
nr:DUF1772 domain-containing protein [Streptomyces spiramenti]